jgi:WD40 repeat protein
VAVLADGRVVTGGSDARVLGWDPAQPGSGPVELGHHGGPVRAVAVLADGWLVSGGDDGRVLRLHVRWPASAQIQLARHSDAVRAVAVLADDRVVSGGTDRRVLIWNATTKELVAELSCTVSGLAAAQASHGEAFLVIIHKDQGFSVWSIAKDAMSHSD